MNGNTFSVVQRVLFFSLLAGGTGLFLWMLRDFALPLLWALILAVILYPLVTWLARYTKHTTLAVLVTITVLLIGVIGPVSALGTLIAGDTTHIYQEITQNGAHYIAAIEAQPLVADTLALFGIDANSAKQWAIDSAKGASQWLIQESYSLTVATLHTTVQFLLMIYVLFFLLRDGHTLGRYLMRILPLGDERELLLFRKFASTTRAMVKGTLVVALVQGTIGGVLFWATGVPSPALWGAVMAFTAIIPAIGPSIVWLPAGVIMAATGNLAAGLIILAVGGVGISLIDNILRPILVGRDTEMPDALILLAILGGLATFGLTGIIIGPVVAALFLAIWSLFETEYSLELAERG